MFANSSGGIETIMAEMAWWQEQEDGWSHHVCTCETEWTGSGARL